MSTKPFTLSGEIHRRVYEETAMGITLTGDELQNDAAADREIEIAFANLFRPVPSERHSAWTDDWPRNGGPARRPAVDPNYLKDIW